VRAYIEREIQRSLQDKVTVSDRLSAEKLRFFELCRGYDTMAVKAAFVSNLAIAQAKDKLGISAIHMACMNTHDEGPEIVDLILNFDSLAARSVDSLGQLPLHVACRNAGPFTAKGFPLHAEQTSTKRSCIYRLVLGLLRVYPQAASQPDMDGLLPLDLALNNENLAGSRDAIALLLSVYPDAIKPEPILPGSSGLNQRWKDIISILGCADQIFYRQEILTIISQPLTRKYPDGYTPTGDARNFISIENSCPVFQTMRISFEALRTRLLDIYGGREADLPASKARTRVQLEKYLQGTDIENRDILEATAIQYRYFKRSKKKKTPKVKDTKASSSAIQRRERWRLFGIRYPQFFVKMLNLPKAYTTGIGSYLTNAAYAWYQRLMHFRPKDLWSRLERLPAHAAAARSAEDSLQILSRILTAFPHGARMRDHMGRLPLHLACSNEKAGAEYIVEYLIKLHPLAVHAQDHSGMLPLHYAARSSGLNASGVAGRLISVFPCAAQTVDDFGLLPIDWALRSSSANAAELIKAIARAFIPGCRIQDENGDNLLHRICTRIRDDDSDEAMCILKGLLAVRIRPNLCSLYNNRRELPMHIVAACRSHHGAEAIDLLAEAYLPACWTQVCVCRASSTGRDATNP
jgi:ankyrin repeat protein